MVFCWAHEASTFRGDQAGRHRAEHERTLSAKKSISPDQTFFQPHCCFSPQPIANTIHFPHQGSACLKWLDKDKAALRLHQLTTVSSKPFKQSASSSSSNSLSVNSSETTTKAPLHQRVPPSLPSPIDQLELKYPTTALSLKPSPRYGP